MSGEGGPGSQKKPRNRNRGKRENSGADASSRNETAQSAVKAEEPAAESPAKKHRGDAPATQAAPIKSDVAEAAPKDDVLTAYMTSEKFSSLNICAQSKRALAEVMKFNFMTHVQATCIGPIQQGHDCLAKSKTGTG